MSQERTPGPWTLRNNGQTFIIEGALESHPIGGPGRGHVCSLGWFRSIAGDFRKKTKYEPTARQIGNAALLLSSPQLLSALEKIRQVCYVTPWVQASDTVLECIRLAEEAIAETERKPE